MVLMLCIIIASISHCTMFLAISNQWTFIYLDSFENVTLPKIDPLENIWLLFAKEMFIKLGLKPFAR